MATSSWAEYGRQMYAYLQAHPTAYAGERDRGLPDLAGQSAESYGRLIAEHLQRDPEAQARLQAYPAASQGATEEAPQVDYGQVLQQLGSFFGERPGALESAMSRGMPAYDANLSARANVDHMVDFLRNDPEANQMLLQWPVRSQALVREDELSGLEDMYPEVHGIAKRFREQGLAQDDQLRKVQAELETLKAFQQIQANMASFKQQMTAPGSRYAQDFDERAVYQAMVDLNTADPAKAWAMMNAPKAEEIGQRAGRIQAESEMTQQGRGRAPINRSYQRKSETDRVAAAAEGPRPGQPFKPRSTQDVAARVESRLAERGITDHAPTSTTELREQYHEYRSGLPGSPGAGRPVTPERPIVSRPSPTSATPTATPTSPASPALEPTTTSSSQGA